MKFIYKRKKGNRRPVRSEVGPPSDLPTQYLLFKVSETCSLTSDSPPMQTQRLNSSLYLCKQALLPSIYIYSRRNFNHSLHNQLFAIGIQESELAALLRDLQNLKPTADTVRAQNCGMFKNPPLNSNTYFRFSSSTLISFLFTDDC